MRLGSLCLVLVAAASAAVWLPGCSSDDSGGGSGGGSGSGGAGGGSAACKPTDATCYVAGADGPGNACMAKADFSSADVAQLRLTSHQVKSPVALAAPFVQDSIITKKSTLFEPSCNLDGVGQFNYLMQVDTATKELTIGGGAPQNLIGDALSGTCWVEFDDTTSGLSVKQVKASYTEAADGTISATFPNFVMPIYLEDKTDPDSYVLVPLHEMTFTAKLSSDKNCVGRYAPERLDPGLSCQPTQDEFAWDPAGTYEGYITVEEADKVMVVSLGETLCVVLTGDPAKWKGTDADCKTSKGFTSTGGLPKGDWCSSTNSAAVEGVCEDAWKLVIDFAAQAIDIKGVHGKGC